MISKLRIFFASDTGVTLVIAVAWQAIFTLLGLLTKPDPSGVPLFHTTQWDGAWYMDIIKYQYTFNPASPAFYPLFPLIVSTLSILTFHLIPFTIIGLFINTVCLWLALKALLLIAREFAPEKFRYLSILFFLAAPAAFFMHLFYTEALFVALAFWAYILALKQRWLFMGILLGFLTASRLPSLLFIGLCGLEYLRAYGWNIKKAFNPNLAYFLLAPIGFTLYGLYLLTAHDNFFAMFHAYSATKDWVYQSFEPNFIHTLFRAAHEIYHALKGARPFDNDMIVNHTIPLLCIGILFFSSLYLLFKYRNKGIPLGIFGLCSIVFFTLNNNLVSVHRYTLPCLTIYIALLAFYTKYHRLRIAVVVITLIMLAAQIELLSLQKHSYFVG